MYSMRQDYNVTKEQVDEHDKSLHFHSKVCDERFETNIALNEKVNDLIET